MTCSLGVATLWSLLALVPVPFIQHAHTQTERQTHRGYNRQGELRTNGAGWGGFTMGRELQRQRPDQYILSSLAISDADVSSGRPCCNRGTEPRLLISSPSVLLCSTTLAFALLCSALFCSLPSPQFRAGRIVPPPIIYLLRARQPAQPRLHLSAASFSCYDSLPCFTRLTRPLLFHIPVRDAHQARTAPSMMHRSGGSQTRC